MDFIIPGGVSEYDLSGPSLIVTASGVASGTFAESDIILNGVLQAEEDTQEPPHVTAYLRKIDAKRSLSAYVSSSCNNHDN